MIKERVNKWFKRGGLFLLVWPTFIWAQSIQLNQIHYSVRDSSLQLIVKADFPFKYKIFKLANPQRIVIDLPGVNQFDNHIFGSALLNTPVTKIRSSIHSDHTLRIVLDVTNNKIKLNLSSEYAHRQSLPPPQNQKAASADSSAQTAARPIIIVIDPGHGGKDPGATGIKNIHEKDVVLNIARNLQFLINQQPGFKALLTRDSDYYLTLRDRLTIARKYQADMFIAIHADAYPDPDAHGVSVFALSQRGASSEAARWLADNENQSELMGGVQLSDKEDMLRSVLINLSQTTTIQSSLLIGNDLLDNIKQFAYLHHDHVEQAAFVVLKSPDIPSLLLETGFLSNSNEARNLVNPNYQQTIAQAVMLGIKQFFWQRPPPGTWLATHGDANAH